MAARGSVFGRVTLVSGPESLLADPATGQLVSGDITAETEQVMKNLKAVLTAAGSDFTQVVRTTIYLTDLAHFQAVNEAYGKHFGAAPPARATVQVAGLPKGARVEIDCIALVR